MKQWYLACLLACAAFAAHAQSSGAVVALDDGSLVVAAGSSVTHSYGAVSKVATMFVGLGYGAAGDTYDSAALGLESITADGKPNTRFGSKGFVVTPLRPLKNHDGAVATALLRDARGRVIVVGWRTQSLWLDAGVVFIAAARYDSSGALDPTFGDHGLVNVRYNSDGVTEASAASLDAQGRLLVAGYNGGRRTKTKLGSFDEWTNHLMVARFTADGRIDTSFGQDGFALADIVPLSKSPRSAARYFLVYDHAPAGLAIDAQNRIVAGASASDGTYVLARFLDDGKLDPSFGSNGTVRTAMPAKSTIAHVLIDRSGRLLVVGSKGDHIALARYTADGNLIGDVRETAFASGLVPAGAVRIANDRVFVAAAGEHTLAVGLFDAEGTPVKSITSAEVPRLTGPAGLTVNAAGKPTVAARSEDGVAVLR
jgi:uncharacterized delta-60 repeat protein